MPIATGVNKVLTIKKETTSGTLAGTGSGQNLGRVTSDLSLTKEAYASQEIVGHFQQSDVRHGVRSVRGNIKGEPAPGAYQQFFEAALRRLFTAVTALTGMTIAVAGAGPTWTLTRSAGSFLSDGVKVGMVGRLTAGTFNVANLNRNLLIVAVTATVATVVPLNVTATTPLFAEAGITGATLTIPGRHTYAPPSGHTDESFTIEHYFADITRSERFVGCKIDTMAVNLPPTGLAELDVAVFGQNATYAGAQYFVSPAAASSAGKLAAVNGVLCVAGVPVALLTGLSLNINGNMTSEPVVGSNLYPEIFEGRVLVDGQATVMYQDGTFNDYFDQETEISLVGAFATGSSNTADFIAISLPRLKFKSGSKSDGEKAVILTMAFDGLYYGSGGAAVQHNQTSMQVHDSLAA